MATIDLEQPIRSIRSKRRLYVGTWFVGGFYVDTMPMSSTRCGARYNHFGTPLDEANFGPIENFEDSPFETIIDTQLEREREAFAEAMGDNELFGIF